jgi:hypothetical protein
MIAIAIWGGSTSAIIGTVSNGVPTPSAPLIKPPQHSAKKHQATIQGPYSANKSGILEASAASYQLAVF